MTTIIGETLFLLPALIVAILLGSVTFCVGTESGPNARSVRLEHSQPT